MVLMRGAQLEQANRDWPQERFSEESLQWNHSVIRKESSNKSALAGKQIPSPALAAQIQIKYNKYCAKHIQGISCEIACIGVLGLNSTGHASRIGL
jgi:hypothetical protein